MSRKAKYGVKFVGYSGYVVARKYGREVDYAQLDFISGVASVQADGGWVMVSKRADLGPFLKDLPNLASELRKRLAVGPEEGIEVSRDEPGRASKMVSMCCGKNEVQIAPDADVNKFIRQITRRFAEIEQLLEQAEQIGSRIERRPYSEYLDEIGKSGLARVEGHGGCSSTES
jgi:hypothetical protein